MSGFLRKAIGVTLLFSTIGLSTCQSFLEASQVLREGNRWDESTRLDQVS